MLEILLRFSPRYELFSCKILLKAIFSLLYTLTCKKTAILKVDKFVPPTCFVESLLVKKKKKIKEFLLPSRLDNRTETLRVHTKRAYRKSWYGWLVVLIIMLVGLNKTG